MPPFTAILKKAILYKFHIRQQQGPDGPVLFLYLKHFG